MVDYLDHHLINHNNNDANEITENIDQEPEILEDQPEQVFSAVAEAEVCEPDFKYKVITNIIGLEGDYVNHPDDGGGKTRFGITEAKAREHGYHGDMRHLPYDTAFKILEKDFYDALNLEEVAKMSKSVAEEIADTATNTGTKPAVKFLQKALNALNNRGRDYPDISVDGVIGRMTLQTLKKYFNRRKNDDGEAVLLMLLNMFQTQYYFNEATEMPQDKHESFLFGWIRNRVLNKFKVLS